MSVGHVCAYQTLPGLDPCSLGACLPHGPAAACLQVPATQHYAAGLPAQAFWLGRRRRAAVCPGAPSSGARSGTDAWTSELAGRRSEVGWERTAPPAPLLSILALRGPGSSHRASSTHAPGLWPGHILTSMRGWCCLCSCSCWLRMRPNHRSSSSSSGTGSSEAVGGSYLRSSAQSREWAGGRGAGAHTVAPRAQLHGLHKGRHVVVNSKPSWAARPGNTRCPAPEAESPQPNPPAGLSARWCWQTRGAATSRASSRPRPSWTSTCSARRR